MSFLNAELVAETTSARTLAGKTSTMLASVAEDGDDKPLLIARVEDELVATQERLDSLLEELRAVSAAVPPEMMEKDQIAKFATTLRTLAGEYEKKGAKKKRASSFSRPKRSSSMRKSASQASTSTAIVDEADVKGEDASKPETKPPAPEKEEEQITIPGGKRHWTAPRFKGEVVGKGPTGKYSIIQWETAAFFCYESEEGGKPVPPDQQPQPPITYMSLTICRLGSAEGKARCQWRTFDMSARAGVHYKGVEETWVDFEDGETMKDVKLEVFNRYQVDGMMELGVYINEQTAEGAGVGKYLHTASIKIIDMSMFPTNDLRPWVAGGKTEKIAEIEPYALIWSFLRLCMGNETCWAGTKKVIFFSQYESLVAIGNIFIMLYVVKTLTAPAEGPDSMTYDEQKAMISLLGILWVAPFVATHYFGYRKNFWKVAGSLKKQINGLIYKKFLNYDESSRGKITTDKIVMALTR